MRERDLRVKICDLADALGLLWTYNPDSRRCLGSRGVPDLMIAGPRGVIPAELKESSGSLSQDQEIWAAWLPGFRVWRPEHWVSGRVREDLERIAA
jgi:hypothetical protein